MTDFDPTAPTSKRRAAPLQAATDVADAGPLEDMSSRLAESAAPDSPIASARASRRQVLVRGAGALAALAGGTVLGRAPQAGAAVTPLDASATFAPVAAAPPKQLALRVTLAPLQTHRAVWVDHEWDFGAHFTGATPPVVVATALDDYMPHDPSTFCVCAVAVHGAPGAYRATLMVRNVHPHASSVVINAVAIGA